MRHEGYGNKHLGWALVGVWALASSVGCDRQEDAFVEQELEVVFDEMPTGTGSSKSSDASEEEECTTGCSLAKHYVPVFTEFAYETKIREYGALPLDPDNPALETLLFYGGRTRSLIKELGTGDLDAEHLDFLRRELRRDHALVSLRMVDENGVVKVSYGPTSVPLGTKQHLQAVGENLSAMEFNGTVMRTGVNYLWSRY